MSNLSIDGLSDDTSNMVYVERQNDLMPDRNFHAGDGRLIVKFYDGHLLNPEKSKAAGRPIHDSVCMVKILDPGKIDHVDRMAWEQDYQRFSRQYEAYKKGKSHIDSGTPLKHWPVISAAQVADFAAVNIHTVEQLATLSDIDAQRFMGAHAIIRAAKDFVQAAKSNAPLLEMRSELEKRDSEIATLKVQMAEILKAKGISVPELRETAPAVAEMLEPTPEPIQFAVPKALEPAAPKKRGRPAKAQSQTAG